MDSGIAQTEGYIYQKQNSKFVIKGIIQIRINAKGLKFPFKPKLLFFKMLFTWIMYVRYLRNITSVKVIWNSKTCVLVNQGSFFLYLSVFNE